MRASAQAGLLGYIRSSVLIGMARTRHRGPAGKAFKYWLVGNGENIGRMVGAEALRERS